MSTSSAPTGEVDLSDVSLQGVLDLLRSHGYESIINEAQFEDATPFGEYPPARQDTPNDAAQAPPSATSAATENETQSGIPTGDSEEDGSELTRAVGSLEPTNTQSPSSSAVQNVEPENASRLLQLFQSRENALANLQNALQPMSVTLDGREGVTLLRDRDDVVKMLAIFEALFGPLGTHERTWEQGLDDIVLVIHGYRGVDHLLRSSLPRPTLQASASTTPTNAQIVHTSTHASSQAIMQTMTGPVNTPALQASTSTALTDAQIVHSNTHASVQAGIMQTMTGPVNTPAAQVSTNPRGTNWARSFNSYYNSDIRILHRIISALHSDCIAAPNHEKVKCNSADFGEIYLPKEGIAFWEFPPKNRESGRWFAVMDQQKFLNELKDNGFIFRDFQQLARCLEGKFSFERFFVSPPEPLAERTPPGPYVIFKHNTFNKKSKPGFLNSWEETLQPVT